VTVDLSRGECTKSVPITVVNTGNNWIINQIDLNLAEHRCGPASRRCPSSRSPDQSVSSIRSPRCSWGWTNATRRPPAPGRGYWIHELAAGAAAESRASSRSGTR
jgi:hypothetical protein